MEYDEEEYNKAQETVDFYNARAITVLRNLGNAEYLKWFNDCEETFVSVYDKNVGNCAERIVRVVLWMGYEYEPSHRVVEFPWEMMNTPNVHIPDAYAKWRKEEDEKLAAAKAIKDKYWAEVREKYRQQQQATT